MIKFFLGCLFSAVGMIGFAQEVTQDDFNSLFKPSINRDGHAQTVINIKDFPNYKESAFFKTFGPNGRNCFSCHRPDQGWTITPEKVQERFYLTRGMDPIFVNFDGSNCREASSYDYIQRKKDYSLLLTKGLIRVDLDIPANADFTLIGVDDPHKCKPKTQIATYRRPLPTTNLRFLTGVMWDTRESGPNKTLRQSLLQQAADATSGHAESKLTLTDAELNSIVDFEMALHTAQSFDNNARSLETAVNGGPANLAKQKFFIGINDPLDPAAHFTPESFNIFNPWAPFLKWELQSSDDASSLSRIVSARAAVIRGQKVFTSKEIQATGVMGLNDVLGQPTMKVTCTTCHNSPNVGNHSTPFPVDLGLSEESRRTPDLPLYTFKCADGKIVKTTDPGRAMVTGKCKDMNKMKGPILRALAARAPYFHNGSAAKIEDVIEFYNTRFNIQLSQQEKSDLAVFLKTL